MPKIIENLEEKLINEARRQIRQYGYSAMTMRSVAKACGVGVGTVYNYFPCKEALVASYLLQDWRNCATDFEAVSAVSQSPRPVLRQIYDHLTDFSHRHLHVFRDEAAAVNLAGSFTKYHGMLRTQLAQSLRKFCENDFTAEFLAEALLTWTIAGKSFEELYCLLEKFF
jgi:AcrR family transcriptional regulator